MNKYNKIHANALQLISDDLAWKYFFVPKGFDNNTLSIYISDNIDTSSITIELEIILGYNIEYELIPEKDLNRLLIKYYRNRTENRSREDLVIETDFLEKLITEAGALGSSDIHIEPYEDVCRVRYRLDGKLLEKFVISIDEYPSLINKLKIKANLDIAEKRRPQDGRIKIKNSENDMDIRVSVVPTIFGEKAVLRLLKKNTTAVDIDKIGFNKTQLELYTESIHKDHGIVLISGPTGSGKTTTLYATLKLLNDETVNISTVEDPIEYTLEGINQVQLNEKIGLNFASVLRTFLRQDPDIIMLGEIRDFETAEMAVRSALTGHLVLSTIHTNSAWGTISRLIDMGIPPFLLASVLNASIAQRLIRKLCNSCKEKISISNLQSERNFIEERKIDIEHIYSAVGCADCHYTGYSGRVGIFEIIPIDNEVSQFVKENRFNIREHIDRKGLLTLFDQAVTHLKNGDTSFDEVYPILLSNNY